MEDVRARRGADVASNHHLVVANLKLKLKKNWTTGQTAIQMFNTAFLRDTDKLNEFKIALSNRFQASQDLVLGLKKYHHKEWISIETLDKIKERKNKKTAINNSRTRAEKVQAQAEYTEANKQVKRSIRANKKECVEELATTVKKAAKGGNMKRLYDTMKKLAGKYSKPEKPVKDKEGGPIKNRGAAPLNLPDNEAAHTYLPLDVNPPTTEEIRMAIRQIKSGKAAGPDSIPAEALNSDIEPQTCFTFYSRRIRRKDKC
ncbi:unnamed protein product [Schistosoma curassoni]|uniref:Reverse transcriptase domain-containing protein n=1 Tax=Schistosoma curassoni TaxID=6186 RepID=A0A183KKK4_9TREM|nr:unnamed protein product [Schistosoma curassoni]